MLAFTSKRGIFHWEGVNGFTSTSSSISIDNLRYFHNGDYHVTFVNEDNEVSEATFTIQVDEQVPVIDGTYYISYGDKYMTNNRTFSTPGPIFFVSKISDDSNYKQGWKITKDETTGFYSIQSLRNNRYATAFGEISAENELFNSKLYLLQILENETGDGYSIRTNKAFNFVDFYVKSMRFRLDQHYEFPTNFKFKLEPYEYVSHKEVKLDTKPYAYCLQKMVYVDCETIASVAIKNMQGKMVLISNQSIVDVNNIIPGIYFVVISYYDRETNLKQTVRKVLVY